jgi:imidazolonepropionase-like amidohydrolase
MVDHGMSQLAALRAGTIDAAMVLGLEKQIGSLENGKIADIIAVSGNPFSDIHATEHVIFVMKNGEITKKP